MCAEDHRAARSEYLLGGRRVRLSDLIEADLLSPGDVLRFGRPRLGEVYHARVTETGGVALEDGRTYSSPSRAAAVAADVSALDGWNVWFLEKSGRSIDSLRQELLDRGLEGSGEQHLDRPDTEPAPISRHEYLKDARSRADEGEALDLSVRELLDLWDAKSRGHRISERIETELANHGLATLPNFRKVTLDSRVTLNLESKDQRTLGPEGGSTDAEHEEFDVGLTIGNLTSSSGGVVSVTPNSTFEEAITLMLLNDYAQLAVMSGSRALKGAITWRSIAQARHANPNASFPEAIVRAHEVRFDQELIDVLPTLYEADFIFVRDETNAISGIVTTADVVRAYGDLATPFFLIGELDQLLRRLIGQTYSLADVRSLCDPDETRSIESFDDLSLGDYQQVLANPDRWADLRWPLDRAAFGSRLDELREVRNDVMHFNPDPVPTETISKLRHILRVLREYGD